MLDLVWFKLLELAVRAKREEGLVTIEWLVIAGAMAVAAAAAMLAFKGPIEHAVNNIVSALNSA
jgi:Flp pilus assembly pilin Flp